MSYFNIVSESNESTVVTEYKPIPKKSEAYQSEAELEKEFISMLKEQAYEYLPIRHESDLIQNLRKQLEELNNFKFTDNEWNNFFSSSIANGLDSIKEKTKKIQEEKILLLRCDNGDTKNIRLIDDKNIHNNKMQVINQYEADNGKYKNRYDVTILVNGLPLVHVELKKRGVPIRKAFNQIEEYQKDSFWSDSGLFEYMQIFVISNGTHTKYYSNTTRYNYINEKEKAQRNKVAKTSNGFEFTSYWADSNNKIIPDLIDFTRTFFAKHTILSILTKYCVFTSDELLLVMRPYQIVATERIINRIKIADNYKKYGTVAGGGYIWHTTGSGKTLTSFKTAQIASKLDIVDKVLFVVDRKDLDYQTMREYDKFERGAANSNSSTAVLKKQLENPNAKIIITTIQKLSIFVEKNKGHEIFGKKIVIIFDECHRSQFGDMHKKITKSFKKYFLFGFTGTPIFSYNASISGNKVLKTTEQAFGDGLHTYIIVDAINDNNVLPFKVDYIKTVDFDGDIEDSKVKDIDREAVWLYPKRIKLVTSYILNNFDKKTYRNEKNYNFNRVTNISDVISSKNKIEEKKQKVRISGFNSILCVSSIDAAKLYYNEFKRQMEENPSKKIRIATIFSYGVNEDESCILDEENSEDTINLDDSSRDFLESAIKDYNEMFMANYDTSSDKFQNYYKDVSMQMKNKQIDLLIVVNMFLTGFDATTLNTLWVDKNLRLHGLIQAFSRTNRILNDVKKFGNIVCFRNLQRETDEAISLFGDKEAGGLVLMKSFKDYYFGYKDKNSGEKLGYKDLINSLQTEYPLSDVRIEGEEKQKEFIALFGSILRMRNVLSSFDEFEGNEILSEREFQDYVGRYNDLYYEWKKKKDNDDKSNINDDVIFEIELIKQIEINIDYILMLIKKYHDSHCGDKEILVSIDKAISSSFELRSKKELIENFIERINAVDDVMADWCEYVKKEKEKQLNQIIIEEGLDAEKTKVLINNSFRDGSFKTTGTDIDKIMPPISRFGGGRTKKKKGIIERLIEFFECFFGLIN